VKVEGAAGVDAVDVRAWVAPEGGRRRDGLLGARLNALVLCPLQDKVDAEGRSVSGRVARMMSGTDPVAVQVSASMPRPPAFETAAASSGVVALPTGACTTGAVRPSLRQSGVSSRLALSGIADHSYHTEMRSHRCAAHGRKRHRPSLRPSTGAASPSPGPSVEGPASHWV
jgi:hypothetical protein